MKKNFLIALASFFALLFLVFLWFRNDGISRNNENNADHIVEDTVVLQEPELLFGYNLDTVNAITDIIQRNESLGVILARYGVQPDVVHEISKLPRDTFNVTKLLVNKPYTIIRPKDTTRCATSFIYHPNPIDYVMLDWADSLKVIKGKNHVDTIQETLTGTIETSLYDAITEAGGSPVLVNELADVYAWEIDFFGLQKGDAFKVVYERFEVKGADAGMGKIISSYFEHMNAPFYAFRYDQGEGDEYFDEEGKSLRKTFLKAPLRFSRISSGFSYSRLHPILKIRRPHLGVDYAAPTGTPVVSVGDGVVIRASYSKGGGHVVKVKHNGNYTTAYLHLSRYGKGIKSGTVVKQGQIIGYVGSTGLSTGPHLDFRFYKNGKAVDPLKIDPPSANPIKEEILPQYKLYIKDLKKQIDRIPLNTQIIA